MPTPRSTAIAFALVAGLSGSGCAQSGNRVDTPATDRATTGSIAGHIQHPAHAIPAMRICAIGSGAPAEATRICVRTPRGQGRYRIDGLPADEYVVIAETSDGTALYRVGGHMQQVQCIRAPCPEMPKSVTVTPGATVDGIDLNGFYDRRDDFPALPPA